MCVSKKDRLFQCYIFDRKTTLKCCCRSGGALRLHSTLMVEPLEGSVGKVLNFSEIFKSGGQFNVLKSHKSRNLINLEANLESICFPLV